MVGDDDDVRPPHGASEGEDRLGVGGHLPREHLQRIDDQRLRLRDDRAFQIFFLETEFIERAKVPQSEVTFGSLNHDAVHLRDA